MSGSQYLISVVVCTFNRSRLLRSVLDSLYKQTLPRDRYEVIVVDNRSTDDTRAVVDDFLSCGNIRYIYEARQGLAHARNAGWQAAEGSYVGYLDDDSLAPPEWLSVASDIAGEGRFEIFGGPIHPYYSVARPAWYKESYDMRMFGVAEEPLVFKGRGFLSGGNFFVSKRLLSLADGFRSDFGMVSRKLAYGEETDLLLRLRALMPELEMLCDPKLYNYHLVRPEKFSLWWNTKNSFSRGRNSPQLFADPLSDERRIVLLSLSLKTSYKFIKRTFVSLYARDKAEYPYWKNYFKEQALRSVHKLGRIYFHLTNKPM